jgi:hypothetical protein
MIKKHDGAILDAVLVIFRYSLMVMSKPSSESGK